MAELLETYSIEGENVGSIEKKEIHEKMKSEYKEQGKVTLRHKDVKLIVLTSSGRIILQRRSKWKGDNPGKWDKTIGGHVTENDSFDLTMLKECAEELGIPATIVKPEEFKHTVQVTNLYVLGIITKLSYLDNFQSKREQSDGTFWIEPSMTQFYLGYYDGAIRFIDKESCGIQVFTIEEIEKEMQDNPNAFTDDVKYILEKFKEKLVPIEHKREHKLNY